MLNLAWCSLTIYVNKFMKWNSFKYDMYNAPAFKWNWRAQRHFTIGSCTGRFMKACEIAPKIVLVTMLNLLYLMNECI